MSFLYVVRPRADRDLDEIADYLVQQSGTLDIGLRFLSEVSETFALLASSPDLGWPCKVSHPQ